MIATCLDVRSGFTDKNLNIIESLFRTVVLSVSKVEVVYYGEV